MIYETIQMKITSLFSIYSIKHHALAASLIYSAACLTSCSDPKEPDPEPDPSTHPKTAVLIYAVASNNLSYDFANDMKEALQGAESLDFNESEVWVYSLTPKELPTLRHMVKDTSGEISLEVVREYDRDTYSTDPKRISEVIDTYVALTENAHSRGLIMWSHATGWSPAFSDHEVTVVKNAPAISGQMDISANYWYGADQYNGKTDYCDLLELDDAIPADTFDYIWFDCCYMSAIEVLYQLRDKAPFIVAYPTEVAAEGMPYQLTLPYLAKSNPDIQAAAVAMTDYFNSKNGVFTIAVTDTSKLTELASAAASATPGEQPSSRGLQKYSRSPNGPFYDFGQYTMEWGKSLGESWDAEGFASIMNAAVIYKASSDRGFDNKAIDPDIYSGVSCHYFFEDYTDESDYYKSLDWFKDVYKDFNKR